MTGDAEIFRIHLEARAAQIEAVLADLLGARVRDSEIDRPGHLLAAMRHGTLNGGKRLRPFLVMETAAMLGAENDAAVRAAAAVECIHCYSLIHDDLPAMDNDDLRRGLPTVHVAFDEATAILAGDTLLTIAFETITAPENELESGRKCDLVLELARAAGLGGMAGGQALDFEAEKNPPDEAGIIKLQAMKTGALIRFSCEAGAIVAGAAEADRTALRRFGEAIGLAFQLADDLLDVTAESETMGKATGKDAAHNKATLVALHGTDWARSQLDGLVSEASTLLDRFGDKGTILKSAARFVARRDH
ncbi:MAG: polyprenyl synthetase family protein [Pseudomonadota bacterium]